mmetsp:Transcript_131584/g.319760  ORF Transcript_131584/g.319760 Transcript_131584/m.319760 type:complete len:228 (-) Transcript_131584:741-1424(-)
MPSRSVTSKLASMARMHSSGDTLPAATSGLRDASYAAAMSSNVICPSPVLSMRRKASATKDLRWSFISPASAIWNSLREILPLRSRSNSAMHCITSFGDSATPSSASPICSSGASSWPSPLVSMRPKMRFNDRMPLLPPRSTIFARTRSATSRALSSAPAAATMAFLEPRGMPVMSSAHSACFCVASVMSAVKADDRANGLLPVAADAGKAPSPRRWEYSVTGAWPR